MKGKSLDSFRVALVHDWLYHMRGGEKVLESLAEVFPKATIYTLFSNRSSLSPTLQRMAIKNSFLQSIPGIERLYRWLLPVLPLVIRTLRIEDADLVISSSHCVAKGIRVPQGARHISYCHTPMRYLWGFEREYFGGVSRLLRWPLRRFFEVLKKWDVGSNRSVDYFLCNSEAVRGRIREFYGREAVVVHPPVDAEFFKPDSVSSGQGDYYLVVSALTPYKRVDLAVEAFNHWDRKLWIAGEGPDRKRAERLRASSNIRFLGKVSDDELRRLYTEAKALVFPQEEDFGIVALEAQACGTPVIAFARGGALETIEDGIFFHEQTAEALRKAVLEFESKKFEPKRLQDWARGFDKPVFNHKISEAIQNAIP